MNLDIQGLGRTCTLLVELAVLRVIRVQTKHCVKRDVLLRVMENLNERHSKIAKVYMIVFSIL